MYYILVMNLSCGFVGLPNVGKSTIFNALSKKNIPAENYPFCTIDPNSAIIEVPDENLVSLAKIYSPNKTIFSTVEFVDIAGLVKNAHSGEGLGNQFLSHIRSVKVIVQVVRFFDDNNITHVENRVSPIDDIEIINMELIFADIKTLEKAIEKNEKNVRANSKEALEARSVFSEALNHLNEGKPARTIPLNSKEKEILDRLFLISSKPIIYVANVGESLPSPALLDPVKAAIEKERSSLIMINGKLEAEIIDFSDEEKKEVLESFGYEESGLNLLIKNAYNLLGLQNFYTCGQEEVRSWTIKRGASAVEAAGEIHTDFSTKFIKAEIFHYDDVIKHGKDQLKPLGLIKLVGKEYLMQEGDIAYFLKGQ
jgi:GTP-binding protein YchF